MITRLDHNRIAQLLTQSTQQMDASTLAALASVRQNALHRQTTREAAFALNTGYWKEYLIPHSTQQWIAGGLLAALLTAGTGYWQHSKEQQISDLDVAMLTDDLPIEIFIY